MIGITERKILQKINHNFDDLILNLIVDQFLYPKREYHKELMKMCKSFKSVTLFDSYNIFNNINENVKNELLNNTIVNTNFKDFFLYHYYKNKDSIINIIKTIKLNDTEYFKFNHFNNYSVISIPILNLEEKWLLDSLYYYNQLKRIHYSSQKTYISILDDLEYGLNTHLIENNIITIDEPFERKLLIYQKL